MTKYGLAFAILAACQCSAFNHHHVSFSNVKGANLTGKKSNLNSAFLHHPHHHHHGKRIFSSLWSTTSEAPTISIPKNESYDDLGGCTVGDTRGACLLLEEISISRGVNQIINSVDWRVERGERWGIVGPNGAGKSTLLGAITGTIDMDPGSVALVAPKTRVGYLKQTAVGDSTKTVFEEASSSMAGVQSAQIAVNKAIEAIENGDTSEKALNALDDANKEFERAGGYSMESKVENILRGLGFRDGDSQRLCSEFSGGWQMRIGLAKLLLSEPSLLLLDEPSNHLDSSARDWLGNYLKNYDGTIILVSHDVSLLSACTNSIAEICKGTLQTYVSVTYDTYLEQKAFRAKSAKAEYERNMAEAAKLQAFVDRFGASATKAASAQSRVKMLEKMKKEGKLTPPPQELAEAERWRPSLTLPDPPKAMGDVLLSLKNCDIGYGDDKGILVKNANLEVTRGMKLILRGKNGAGKSTLMKALTNELISVKGEDSEPRNVVVSGERVENTSLRAGVFSQDLAQQLDKDSVALDLVMEYARTGKHGNIQISDEQGRSVMGRLGLSGDKPLRKISALSGGEKARVALSMFSLKANNLILLDEPSNHLDVECIEALGEALSKWGKIEGSGSRTAGDGAIVVVSHDRAFCETVGFTHVGTVQDKKLVIEERDLRDSDWEIYDLAADDIEVDSSSSSVPQKPVELTPEQKAAANQRRKDLLNAPKRIKRLEGDIAKCNAKIASLDQEMLEVGNDIGKLTDLSNEKQKEEAKVEKMEAEWMELEELLASEEA